MLKYLFTDLPKRTSIELRAFDRTLKPNEPGYATRLFFSRISSAQQWAFEQSDLGKDVSFGIAPRSVVLDEQGNRLGTKEACKHFPALWADLDSPDIETAVNKFLLPPSFIVSSGYNFHLYYLLVEPLEDLGIAETLNLYIQESIGADKAAAYGDTLLRVPGTQNHKKQDGDPKPVKVVYEKPRHLYYPTDFVAAFNTPASFLKQVLEGSGNSDRSKRDWGIVSDLVKQGFSDSAIIAIFNEHAIGDKHRESPPNYLPRTIEKARQKVTVDVVEVVDGTVKVSEAKTEPSLSLRILDPREDAPPVKTTAKLSHDGLEVYPELQMAKGPDGYYMIGKENTVTRLSPFVFDIRAMHVSEDENSPDIFVVDVRANGYTWDTFVLPASAFNTATGLRGKLPKAAWVWPGTDRQTNNLRWLLTQEWLEKGKPTVYTTPALGRHVIDFRGKALDLMVTSEGSFDEEFEPNEEVLYVKPTHETPTIKFTDSQASSDEALTRAVSLLTKVNNPSSLFPVLGWFVASYFKPILNLNQIRFPHLMVYGTKGAGKTTLVTKVMQPLMGYEKAETWSANSTPFILLTLLGASTSVPVCLTEYRSSTQSNQDRFLQMLRMAYDTGQDARGRADQTTTTYKMSSPVCIDGEEPFDDPAMVERTISVYMNVGNVQRNSKFAPVLESLQNERLDILGSELCLFTMSINAAELYAECMEKCTEIFKSVPFRVLNNFAITLMGLETVSRFCTERLRMPASPIKTNDFNIRSWFKEILSSVMEDGFGRPRIPLDDFVEDAVNHIMECRSTGQNTHFPYRYNPKKDGPSFGFHLKEAYHWWSFQNTKRRTNIPAKAAINRQLSECMILPKEPDILGRYVSHAANSQTNSGRTMRLYFINLPMAVKSGLDIDTGERTASPRRKAITVDSKEDTLKISFGG